MGIVSKSHAFQLILVLFDAAGIEILSVPVGVNLGSLSVARLAAAVNPSSSRAFIGTFRSDHAQKADLLVGFLQPILERFIFGEGFSKGASQVLPGLFGAQSR